MHAFTSNHVHFYPCLFSYRKLGAIKKLFSKKITDETLATSGRVDRQSTTRGSRSFAGTAKGTSNNKTQRRTKKMVEILEVRIKSCQR